MPPPSVVPPTATTVPTLKLFVAFPPTARLPDTVELRIVKFWPAPRIAFTPPPLASPPVTAADGARPVAEVAFPP